MTDETIIETEAIVDQAPDAIEPDSVVEATIEVMPTVPEAQAMFTDNPGLAAVHTVDGILHRDGVLQRMAIGE